MFSQCHRSDETWSAAGRSRIVFAARCRDLLALCSPSAATTSSMSYNKTQLLRKRV